MRLRRTKGGRSDLCTTEESTEGGNEGMTNDQNEKRREATREIGEIEIEPR